MFQKYPMCLYARGDAQADYVIVYGEGDEAAKRSEGFRGAWESQEKAVPAPEPAVDDAPKRKPGRPRKVTE